MGIMRKLLFLLVILFSCLLCLFCAFQVYPNKYCHLVESENGIELLQEVIEHPNPYYRIKELATMVLRHCTQEKDTEMVYEG